MTDHDKYQLVTQHFVPGPGYEFVPLESRKFQHSWFSTYPWLTYSEHCHGGFCLPCVLFAKCQGFRSAPDLFVKRHFGQTENQLVKALEKLKAHNERGYHHQAVLDFEQFKDAMSNSQPTIQQQLDQQLRKQIQTNRLKICSIIETIVLCGRQNIPLRGHRDSAMDKEKDPCAPHGNFWALLGFRVSSGDTVLRDHLDKAPATAKYTSPDVQNQVIAVLGDHIQSKILTNIRRAKFFSIVADEVTDCSNKEQLSLVLRYVHPDTLQIREDLIQFVECDTGITGRALADKMTATISALGLNLQNMRGQGYDGAGNMSGKTNGAAAIISSSYPLALYLHCASHSLNLAVVKSLDIPCVRNMIGVVNKVSIFFFAHPKRQRKLEESICSTQPSSTIHKLKNLCRTRWIERIDALERFKDLYSSIVSCFESISSEGSALWSSDSLTDASTLLLAITTTSFVSALIITNKCLNYLLALTKSLQAEAKDIVEAAQEVTDLKHVISDVREKVDRYHSQWFTEVEQMCQSVGTQPSLPRTCGRQTHRSNAPADTPSEFYRRTVTIPMLDHILSEIGSRFSSHQKTALLGLYLIPSLLVTKTLEEVTETLKPLEMMYSGDLNDSNFVSELHQWYVKWKREENTHGINALPTSLCHTLPYVSSYYANIGILLRLLCTLPVTSCSSERSFSALKRIKTSLRSTMGNERLTGLTLLHIHRDIDIDIQEVIDEFARRHPRRMKLANLLE